MTYTKLHITWLCIVWYKHNWWSMRSCSNQSLESLTNFSQVNWIAMCCGYELFMTLTNEIAQAYTQSGVKKVQIHSQEYTSTPFLYKEYHYTHVKVVALQTAFDMNRVIWETSTANCCGNCKIAPYTGSHSTNTWVTMAKISYVVHNYKGLTTYHHGSHTVVFHHLWTSVSLYCLQSLWNQISSTWTKDKYIPLINYTYTQDTTCSSHMATRLNTLVKILVRILRDHMCYAGIFQDKISSLKIPLGICEMRSCLTISQNWFVGIPKMRSHLGKSQHKYLHEIKMTLSQWTQLWT